MLRRTRLRATARLRAEEGASAVEFALVLPLLVALLFGIIEFGAAFNAQIMVTNAAREAAREFAIRSDAELAEDAAASALSTVGLSIDSISMGAVGCTPGTRFETVVTVERGTLTGLFGPFTLTGKASRLCEP
jgi:Flp pilus assembly protein TadG